MAGHDIIVVGGSSGAIDALKAMAAELPADLPAAVLVVVHLQPGVPSAIPQILARAGPLPAAHARHGETIEPGRIYVAPPDYHLLLNSGTVRLGHGPLENRFRPAVDPLFRSAAVHYGGRVIGVVLSGSMDDGTAGLLAVKERGGLAVVQDPEDAAFPGMPSSAVEQVEVDHIVPAAELGGLLDRLAREPARRGSPRASETMLVEAEVAEAGMDPKQGRESIGAPSKFGCPECGGVLFELRNGTMVRYRCRVGHAYSAESLMADQADHGEAVLWSALRALEEIAVMSRQLAERGRMREHPRLAARFERRAEETERNAAILRAMLTSRAGPPTDQGARHVRRNNAAELREERESGDRPRAPRGRGRGVR